jgi:hypothetical protein
MQQTSCVCRDVLNAYLPFSACLLVDIIASNRVNVPRLILSDLLEVVRAVYGCSVSASALPSYMTKSKRVSSEAHEVSINISTAAIED